MTLSAINKGKKSMTGVIPPSVEWWRSLIAKFAGEIPVNFALAWVQEESAGRPCAIGGVVSPPKEYGIGQLYYPDDNNLGDRTKMRAMCAQSGNTRQELETQVRPLTAGEAELHAKSLISLIRKCMGTANAGIQKAGIQWSTSNEPKSYWSLVKLAHGLPAINSSLIPFLTKARGRAPKDFAELSQWILQATPVQVQAANSNLVPYIAQFPRVIGNAKFAGDRA